MNTYFKLTFPVIFAMVSLFASAQKNNNDENIKKANELKQKYADSEAVILNSENTIDFILDKDNVGVKETTREKIMSLRLGNELRRTIFYDINSSVSGSSVRSEKNKNLYVVPVCGNYEQEDYFYTDQMICVYPLQFKGLGEIQNFGYTLNNNDIRYFTKLYFQDRLPVQNITYTFNVPAWLDLEFREMNFDGYHIIKKVSKDPKKDIITYTYTASGLDEFKDEPESFGISHTYPHLLLIAKSYQNDGKKKTIIGSIDDLHKWYNQLVKQLKNDNTEIKPTVEKITAGAKTDIDKIKAVYSWVQDNIRYIAFENGIAGYKPEEASLVFKHKYGDCKGMANLTKSMLKIAGFDARLVWIGTNSIPYDYSVPSLAINNHMICCVFLNNKRYYLDATEKYIGFNDYAERIQGRTAMIENGDSYYLDTIPVLQNTRNLNSLQFDLTMNNNAFKGTCKQTYHGESHEQILYFLNNMKKESQKEFKDYLISGGDKNIVPENITSSDINDKENPYTIQSDVTINNLISNFDNEYYLDLEFYKNFKNEKLKEDRKSDVFFDEKKLQKMVVKLTVPADMKIKQVPSPLDIKSNLFNFSIHYTISKNIITYERTISIENCSIPKSEIGAWNNAIKALSDKYNENIILTKK